MNNYTFTHDGKTYSRINKASARKQYLQGKTIFLLPCNFRFDSPWYSAFPANRKNAEQFTVDETGINNYFNQIVNSFEYYNCTCRETGKYAAFYIERKVES